MSKKQKRMLMRIIIAALLFVSSIVFKINIQNAEYVSIAAVLTAYVIVGYDIIFSAVRNIFNGQLFDENFLMTIASIGAIIIGEYSEAACVMLFFQIGELFQSCSVEKSRKSIAELMDIRPDTANVLKDGQLLEVAAEDAKVGDIIVIKAGERVSLDAVVVSGQSLIDASSLTGESLPVQKGVGDEILSGSVNLSGTVNARVTKEFFDSTASKILELVENSSSNKSKAENFITKFARYYTPAVVISAAVLSVIMPILLNQSFLLWLHRALIFLVISCPCALVISVPMGFFGGIGKSAKNGVLVKGGNFLETLSKADIVVFDKTGTLTKGVFEVVDIYAEGVTKDELLELAAYAESTSTHPIALSILKAYNKKVNFENIENLTELAGFGIKAEIEGSLIYVGNEKLMQKIGITKIMQKEHKTCVHVSKNNEYIGCIYLGDKIKDEAKKAVLALKKAGVKKTVMLTGDNKYVAETTAKEIGIDEYHASLLPQDKAKILNDIKNKNPNSTVCFVGDGINDAVVLNTADVGIAMGALGSDAAIEAADVVLMNDNLLKIIDAVNISKKTLRAVKQNIVFALTVKFAVMLLGALGLANMWQAVFADVGVCIIAILNAFRVLL